MRTRLTEVHGIAEQALAKLGEAASAWPGVAELIPANEYYKYVVEPGTR